MSDVKPVGWHPVGWHQAQKDLLAQRIADDDELLAEYARTHSHQETAEMRKFARNVRADIGPSGVIVEMYSKPNGEYGCSYYMESEPQPDARAAPQEAVARAVAVLDESSSNWQHLQVSPSAPVVSTQSAGTTGVTRARTEVLGRRSSGDGGPRQPRWNSASPSSEA